LAFKERHAEILKILSLRKNVSVQSLTERLQVSEVTIRKDLTRLEEQGKLLRTHGGAVLAEDLERVHALPLRRRENAGAKAAIARRARELIREGDTIFLDAGTTCAALAREIKDMNLRVVTNSIDVMLELAQSPDIQMHALGGSYRREAGSFIGPIALDALESFQIGTAFIGATGISPDGKFSTQNTMEAHLKKKAIATAARRVILADHTKYGHLAFTVFARAEDVDILVVDPVFAGVEAIRDLGVEVLLAEDGNETGSSRATSRRGTG
jgi:DeoR/GlpR family transcriptional regulator of sugar metabolism